jgi:hypothetical protein
MSTRSHLKRAAPQQINSKQSQPQKYRPIPSINGAHTLVGQRQQHNINPYANNQPHQNSNPNQYQQQNPNQYQQQQNPNPNQYQQQHNPNPNQYQQQHNPNQYQHHQYQQHEHPGQHGLIRSNQYQQHSLNKSNQYQSHPQYTQANQDVQTKPKISVSDAIGRLSLRLGYIETKVCGDEFLSQSPNLETQTLLNNIVQRIDGLEKQLKQNRDGCSQQFEIQSNTNNLNINEITDKELVEHIEIVIGEEPNEILEHLSVELNNSNTTSDSVDDVSGTTIESMKTA